MMEIIIWKASGVVITFTDDQTNNRDNSLVLTHLYKDWLSSPSSSIYDIDTLQSIVVVYRDDMLFNQ